MLGKYRSLKTAEDLCRAADILENRRFYIPAATDLNDPLEGRGVKLHIPGYAGISIAEQTGEMPLPLREMLGHFGVLCLTEDCENLQMWVHYADGFKGMCVCVHNRGIISEAKSVQYREGVKENEEFLGTSSEIEEAIRESLYLKQIGWEYEKEFRIIRKRDNCEDGKFFCFDEEDLAAVIMGHCASSEVASFIKGICERLKILLYTTRIIDSSNRVVIVPYGFVAEGGAGKLEYQIEQYCEKNCTSPFSALKAE